MSKPKPNTKKRSSSMRYTSRLKPFNHLERMVIKIDKDNDRLQRKVLLLSFLSVLLTIVSVILTIAHYSN